MRRKCHMCVGNVVSAEAGVSPPPDVDRRPAVPPARAIWPTLVHEPGRSRRWTRPGWSCAP